MVLQLPVAVTAKNLDIFALDAAFIARHLIGFVYHFPQLNLSF